MLNSTVPSSEITTGKPPALLKEATLSATRPPEPVRDAVFDLEFWDCACRSECEYGDNCHNPATYSVFVIG